MSNVEGGHEKLPPTMSLLLLLFPMLPVVWAEVTSQLTPSKQHSWRSCSGACAQLSKRVSSSVTFAPTRTAKGAENPISPLLRAEAETESTGSRMFAADSLTRCKIVLPSDVDKGMSAYLQLESICKLQNGDQKKH
jgi:hypothetical protein